MSAWLGHLDFLIFAALLVAAFFAARVMLHRWARGADFPRHGWLLILPILAMSWLRVERDGQREKEKIADLVAAGAPTYARELARMGHAAVPADVSSEDPTYRQLIRATTEWMEDNRNAHDIYTVRRLPDGRRVFVVDGDTDYNHDSVIEERERGAKPGQLFEVADPGLDRALTGEVVFDFEPITDQWGMWVSAWAPIRDAQGKVEAVVGVDYDAAAWMAAVNAARLSSLLQIALIALFILAAMAAVSVLRRDLALRRTVEEDLRRANDRWKLIVEQMPLPFIDVSPDGIALTWNPAAEKVFGYSAAEMLGRRCTEILVQDAARQELADKWAALLAEQRGFHSVNENVVKDGRRIMCEWYNAPLVDRDGRLVSVVSLAQDLTERLSLQRQVQESQKLNSIGLLAAGVAHDFNNMLTIIQGHTDLILMNEGLPEIIAEDVQHIAAVSERAAHLTRQLLAFSRQRAMFPKPLDLNELVRKATGLLDRVLGDDIRLVCQLAPEVTVVEADATMLEQVITNLAVNARDAMPRGGVLTVATRRVAIDAAQAGRNPEASRGEAIRLTVADTGTGIAAEKLTHIFEPFFTTKEVGRGTGLGLSAVHGIVKQHRGWIEVRSEVSVGTQFEIFLPPCERSTESAPAPAVEVPPRTPPGATILLVEDDAQVRRLAREALVRGGFEVIEASDGPSAEAVWTRERDRISVLCTDMVMPNGLSGRELATLLLESQPDLCVIYCSGYSVEIAVPGFCATERQVFLQKPYMPAGLLAAVHRCLAGQALVTA